MSERLVQVGATKRTVPNARDAFWAQWGCYADNDAEKLIRIATVFYRCVLVVIASNYR
jgi:hypothetical protein